MWTSYFVATALIVIGALALAYSSALFEKREEVIGWLRLAGVIAIAAAYCSYRAFW